MPWKTYVSHDVTADLRNGENLIAIEVVHYLNERRGPADKFKYDADECAFVHRER